MPRSEVQIADSGVHRDRSRINDSTPQCLTLRAVQLGNVQVLGMSVQPIQFTPNPIYGNTFQTMRVMLDHRNLLDLHVIPDRSELRFEDRLGRHVAEVHLLFLHVEVNRHHVHQILVDQVVLMTVNGHIPHVVLIAEDQPGLRSVLTFARMLVVLPLVVPIVALAVVRSWSVGAVLRAYSRRFNTLVDVRTGLTILQQPRDR